jgi:superfamily II DNA or RNA helicase
MREGFTVPARDLRRRLTADANRDLAQGSLFSECGYATTYQSIASAPFAHADRFARERFLLVLDEPHHLAEDGGPSWVEAVRPLVESATTVLAMSGTLARHDRKPIPFIEYDKERRPVVDIEYTRRDALREQAVLPLEVHFLDGIVRDRYTDQAIATTLADGSCSLRTALDCDGYQLAFLRRAMADFVKYRANGYRSQALIVCHTQDAARSAAATVERETDLRVVLAISDERDAQRVLRDFRVGHGDVLVTVSMATEGFDAPDISHLVCLSDIRSTPWLDQCIARATRMNPKCGLPWEQQQAYVYVPDDPAINAYLTAALEEQRACAAEVAAEDHRKATRAFSTRTASSSTLVGEVSHEAVGDEEGNRLPDLDWKLVAEMRQTYPVLHRIDPRVIASVHSHGRAQAS